MDNPAIDRRFTIEFLGRADLAAATMRGEQ
jgi:hypothetical protein